MQIFTSRIHSNISKIRRLEAGFLVVLYVVALYDPQVLMARVRQRVKEGGHHVPSDRILARYPRTITVVPQSFARN